MTFPGVPPFGPPDVLLVVLMLVASWTDIRTMKIKNWLTFPLMLTGVVLSFWFLPHGWDGAAGLLVALLACLPLYRVGPVLSAGDVKMLMAAGALMGPEPVLRAVLFSVALILPVGLVMLTVTRRWGRVREVLAGKAAPTMLFHAPVISVALLLARLQPLPEIW